MVKVIFGGHEYSLTGRLADIIVWLVERRHLLEFGAKWIEFYCRGESVVARHGEEERIERCSKRRAPVGGAALFCFRVGG